MKGFLALVGIMLVLGCIGGSSTPTGRVIAPVVEEPAAMGPVPLSSIQTFYEAEGETCMNDGKPLVLLFSTTWCPHCTWIGATFEKVAYEYQTAGKVEAHHYKLDTGDDSLTLEVEEEVPSEHVEIYREFNPRGSIPTFVFGCRYYRVGNGYEQEGRLDLEEAEFRYVIDQLLEG